MGAVYLAEDTQRGGRVALKVLVPHLAEDERFRRRFLRESQLAASLEHPHIVPIVAAGEEDGVLYLAMSYIDGSDLRELLRREGRLAPERTLHLLGQVAEALDAAHAAGLVHRDVIWLARRWSAWELHVVRLGQPVETRRRSARPPAPSWPAARSGRGSGRERNRAKRKRSFPQHAQGDALL